MDLGEASRQRQVAIAWAKMRVSTGDMGGQPLTVLKRDELILAPVPDLNRNFDVLDGKAPGLQMRA